MGYRYDIDWSFKIYKKLLDIHGHQRHEEVRVSKAVGVMAYIDVVNPEGELVHAGMGLRFPKKTAGDILLKLEKFGVGLLVREDGSVVDDQEDVDSPCVYRLVRPTIYTNPSSTSTTTTGTHSTMPLKFHPFNPKFSTSLKLGFQNIISQSFTLPCMTVPNLREK